MIEGWDESRHRARGRWALGVLLAAAGGIALLRITSEPTAITPSEAPRETPSKTPSTASALPSPASATLDPNAAREESSSDTVSRGIAADPAVSAVDAQATALETQLIANGLLPGYDVKLSAMRDWLALDQLWTESSQPVLAAKNARRTIAVRIANDRLAQKKFETILLRDKKKNEHGGYVGPWNDLQHPDDWVVNRLSFRETEGPIVEHVRIRPGEDESMDEATLNFRLAEDMRREAITKFITEHSRSSRSAR